jgi:hypothetical protein
MTVRCAHCGEELMGAVNRCWKCGQQFVARPTVDGLPPVRVDPAVLASPSSSPAASTEALEARVLADSADDASTAVASPEASLTSVIAAPPPQPPASIFQPPPHPLATPQPMPVPMRRTPQRPNLAALGGAYGAVVLGGFALALAPFRWEAVIVAFVGLLMGIWGIYSPRRNWALVGMLLCAAALGWGTFTGIRQLYLYLNRYAPVTVEEPLEDDPFAP